MALVCRYPRPHASLRMFCFPWAGGGASFFTAWGKDITEEVEVFGVCLPGRETRFKEPVRTDCEETVAEIVEAIRQKYLDKPFIFVGHSMGTLLAYMVARELKLKYKKEPDHMYLSGGTAPHSPDRYKKMVDVRNMTNEQFIARMKELGGTPSDVLENKDLMELFIEPCKADYTMLFKIKIEISEEEIAKPPLSTPIDFTDGDKDPIDHDLHLWKQLTTGTFFFQKMSGGHFFVRDPENVKKFIDKINLMYSGYHDIV